MDHGALPDGEAYLALGFVLAKENEAFICVSLYFFFAIWKEYHELSHDSGQQLLFIGFKKRVISNLELSPSPALHLKVDTLFLWCPKLHKL